MMIHDDQYDENNGTDSFGNGNGINISNENVIASPRLLPFCHFLTVPTLLLHVPILSTIFMFSIS